MSNVFPINSIHGPFEYLASVGGIVAGACIGWRVGSDIVEYATQITQNISVIEMLVENHPLITKLITLGIGAKTLGGVSRIGGEVIDRFANTHYKSD